MSNITGVAWEQGTVLANQARTATTDSVDFSSNGAHGVEIWLVFTVAPNSADTVTLNIQGKDPVTGNYINLGSSAAIAGSAVQANPSVKSYQLKDGIAASANVTFSIALTPTWRIDVAHSAGSTWNYSVGYALIP